MTALVLEAHNDDACLFSAFNAQRHRAHIVTVLRSKVQTRDGVTAAEREAESARAAIELGCTWEQWPEDDYQPDWPDIRAMMERYDGEHSPEWVFAPAQEDGAHDQHNVVGMLAREVFGAERYVPYLTYVRGSERSDWGVEIVPTAAELAAKLRALACFESQMRLESCRPWFLWGQREWVVA